MTQIPADTVESASRLPEWLEVVLQNASKLRFGTVQIVVHDGKVTQVERIQRTRFTPSAEARHADAQATALS